MSRNPVFLEKLPYHSLTLRMKCLERAGLELGSPNHTNMGNALTDLGFSFTKIGSDEYHSYDDGDEITLQE